MGENISMRNRVELTLGFKIDDHVEKRIESLQRVLTRMGNDNQTQFRKLRHNVLLEVTQEAKLIGNMISHFK